MDDISPELLQKLRDNFNERISSDKEITELLEKIQNGNATYKDAERYSVRVGEALKGAFGEELSSAVLPDGHMYYNIGEKTVYPMLHAGYDMVSDAAADTQKALNEAAGLHLQVQRPEFNEDRAHGIIDRLDNTDQFDDAAWILGDPVVNFSQSVVDDTIEENVEFHAKAGLDPRIVRTAEPKCCDWCKDLEGTYEYPAQSYVYERHENCQCVIEYFPSDGTKMRQTNWKHNTWKESLREAQPKGIEGNRYKRGSRERTEELKRRLDAVLHDDQVNARIESNIRAREYGMESLFEGIPTRAPFDIEEALQGTNPYYSKFARYDTNCQRCVIVYEYRRRGFDVQALPEPIRASRVLWGNECFVDSNGKIPEFVNGQTESEVLQELNNAKDGSRYIIHLEWENNREAHVFIAEKENGVVRFLDPQTGESDARSYFSEAIPGLFRYLRIDDKNLTKDKEIIRETMTLRNNG